MKARAETGAESVASPTTPPVEHTLPQDPAVGISIGVGIAAIVWAVLIVVYLILVG